MKKLLIYLSLIAVHYTAYGDARLDFTRYTALDKPVPFSYLIKDQRLRLLEPGSQRFNLFNSLPPAFISLNLQNGNIARMDKNILTQRARQLNQKRLQRLNKIYRELDKKRPSMNEKELELAEEVKNQMKYPRQYGAYTLNKLEKTNTHKEIAGVECQLYTLKRKKQLLKTLCIASQQQLGISADDFATLQAFDEFNYYMQTEIMLAMGDTDFDLVSLKSHQINGVVIEEKRQQDKQKKLQRILTRVSTQAIHKEQLKLPKVKKSQLE